MGCKRVLNRGPEEHSDQVGQYLMSELWCDFRLYIFFVILFYRCKVIGAAKYQHRGDHEPDESIKMSINSSTELNATGVVLLVIKL